MRFAALTETKKNPEAAKAPTHKDNIKNIAQSNAKRRTMYRIRYIVLRLFNFRGSNIHINDRQGLLPQGDSLRESPCGFEER